MKSIVAEGINYFDNPKYPLTVKRVKAGKHEHITHAHDLTEVCHTHDFCELALITRGKAMHWLEDAEFPITAGDVFVLQGNQAHYYFKREGLEMINIMFDPAQLELPENRLCKIPGYRALFLLEPLFRKQHRFSSHLHLSRQALAAAEDMADAMEREVKRQQPGYEVAIYSKFIELVVFLSRSYQESGSNNAEALLRVANVISSIEEDYAREWKVEEFAGMAHMSRSNFMRIFRTATGQAPIDYLIQSRIQQASRLLAETRMTISQVAFEVGFNDSNYFSRQFKRVRGMTPLAFRQTHRRAV